MNNDALEPRTHGGAPLRVWDANCCNGVSRAKSSRFYAMGYSVRTDGWRYTAWAPWNTSALQGDLTGALLGEELYDHRLNRWGASANYSAFENENVVHDPQWKGVKAEHMALLKGMFGETR